MRWFKPMAAALAVCILAGCAPASSSPQPEASGAPVQAAGRYVETDITPDGAQEMSTLLLQANGDTLDFAGMEREAPHAVHHWRSTDGGDSWTEQPVAWSGQIYPMRCAAAADGTLYVYGEATGGGEPDGQGEKALWRAAPGGEAERVQGSGWPDLSASSVWELKMLPGDRLLLSWMAENDGPLVMVEGQPQTGSLTPQVLLLDKDGNPAADTSGLQMELFGNRFTGNADQLFAVDSRGGVCAVPLSGALSSLNGQTLDGYQAGVLAADAAGNLYYPTDDGISRASAGGNLREVVLESGQYSFGDPMNGLEQLAVAENGDFYTALVGADGSSRLCRIRFDASLSSQPSGRLEVYSLYDSYTVRAAISAFRAVSPDTLVEWQPALDADATAQQKEDALRALNARLAAGDGPDVLILDGIDLDALAGKGALEELSGLVDTGGLLPAVAKGMQTEEGLFAVPARFSMPVLLLEQGEKEQFSNWDSILALAESQPAQVTIDPAQPFGGLSKDSQPALRLENMDQLTGLLCNLYGSRLLTDSGLDRDTALRLFEDGARLARVYFTGENDGKEASAALSAGGNGSQAGISVDGGASFSFSSGQTRIGYADLTEFTPLGNTALRGVPVETVPLPGTQTGVWTPRVLAGISAASQQKELAAQFIQTMLGEQVQNYTLGDGLPVLESGFANAWQRRMEEVQNYDSRENVLADPLALAGALDQPLLLPDLLTGTLADCLEKCRTGEFTPRQAADELEKQMQLYFAEQG